MYIYAQIKYMAFWRPKMALLLAIFGLISTPHTLASDKPLDCANMVAGKTKKRQRVKRANSPADRLIREKLDAFKSQGPRKSEDGKRDGRSDFRRSFAPTPVEPDFFNSLKDLQGFNILAVDKSIGVDTIKVAKVVYHVRPRRNQPSLYFINTNKFEYHHDFVSEALSIPISLSQFNANYEGDGSGREFNLATLVYSPRNTDSGHTEFLLEVDETDLLAGEYMLSLYNEIKKRLPLDSTLVLHPLSNGQIELAENQTQLPFVTTSELFDGREYFPLNYGTSVGYVNVATTEEDQNLLSYMDVAIFDEAPLDIGVTAANGSRMYQTPMSHVNVKSKTRNTPNFSWIKALDFFKNIIGKPVRITVGDGTQPEVELLDESTAAKVIADYWKDRRPKLQEDPTFILDHVYKNSFIYMSDYFKDLPDRQEIRELTQIIGAKSANLSLAEYINREGQRFHGVKVPESIGVPFTHYEDFITTKHDASVFLSEEEILDPDTGMDEKLTFKASEDLKAMVKSGQSYSLVELVKERLKRAGLLNTSAMHPMSKVAPILQEIRQLYMKVPINEAESSVLENFRIAIFENENSPIHMNKKVARIRLRSSTNSEDLPGFTGAGLYNSVGVNLYKKIKNPDGTKGGPDFNSPRSWKKIKKDLINALRYDYSGVWNDRAFMEREWFSINGEKHFDIKVGLAAHRAFAKKNQDGGIGEQANFVAVSGNPLNRNYNPKSSGVREFYFNSQHYDLAVTNPPYVDELSEYGEDPTTAYRTQGDLVRLLSLNFPVGHPRGFTEWTIKKISDTSIRNGENVFQDHPGESEDLKQMELRRFTAAIEYLHIGFAKVYGEDQWDYMGDSEGKVYKECDGCGRDLWIKQFREFVRPKPETDGEVI